MFKKISLFLVCASLFGASLRCSQDVFKRGPVEGAPIETEDQRRAREMQQVPLVRSTLGQVLQRVPMGRNTGSGRVVMVPLQTAEDRERNAKIVCCGALTSIVCAIGCCLFSK